MTDLFKSTVFYLYLTIGLVLNIIQGFMFLGIENKLSKTFLILYSGSFMFFFWLTAGVFVLYVFMRFVDYLRKLFR